MNKFGAKSGVLSGKLNSFRSLATCVMMGSSVIGVLGLAACTPQGPNQWMPRGYTYQDDTPLSSPAPSSPWLKEAELKNTDRMSANNAAWQGAVYEIVDQIETILQEHENVVSISGQQPMSTHDLAFDYYIRQALIQKGYKINTFSDQNTPEIIIHAIPLTNEQALQEATNYTVFKSKKNMDLNELYLLSSKIYDHGQSQSKIIKTGTSIKPPKLIGTTRIVASLPYEKNEYMRLPGSSTVPVLGLKGAIGSSYNK